MRVPFIFSRQQTRYATIVAWPVGNDLVRSDVQGNIQLGQAVEFDVVPNNRTANRMHLWSFEGFVKLLSKLVKWIWKVVTATLVWLLSKFFRFSSSGCECRVVSGNDGCCAPEKVPQWRNHFSAPEPCDPTKATKITVGYTKQVEKYGDEFIKTIVGHAIEDFALSWSNSNASHIEFELSQPVINLSLIHI